MEKNPYFTILYLDHQNPDYKTRATDLINAGIGDGGRLECILECIEKSKHLHTTNERYRIQKYGTFEKKLEMLSGENKPKTLLSNYILNKIVDKAISKSEKEHEIISPQKRKLFIDKLFGKK